MNLRQMVVFKSVVENKNMSLAAKQLYVSQSALSQQIAALEEELGCALLLRKANGVTPTNAGAVLYEHATDIIERFSVAEDEVRMADSAVSGTISVGSIYADISFVASYIKSFSKLYPNVHFRIFPRLPSVLEDELNSGKLDVAFMRETVQGRKNFSFAYIGVEEMVMAVPAHMDPNQDESFITIEQLTKLPYCRGIHKNYRESRNWDYSEMLYAECRKRGYDFQTIYECSGTLGSLLLSCAGVAVSFVPLKTVEVVNSRCIHIKRIKGVELVSNPFIVWNNTIQSNSQVELFIQFIISASKGVFYPEQEFAAQ